MKTIPNPLAALLSTILRPKAKPATTADLESLWDALAPLCEAPQIPSNASDAEAAAVHNTHREARRLKEKVDQALKGLRLREEMAQCTQIAQADIERHGLEAEQLRSKLPALAEQRAGLAQKVARLEGSDERLKLEVEQRMAAVKAAQESAARRYAAAVSDENAAELKAAEKACQDASQQAETAGFFAEAVKLRREALASELIPLLRQLGDLDKEEKSARQAIAEAEFGAAQARWDMQAASLLVTAAELQAQADQAGARLSNFHHLQLPLCSLERVPGAKSLESDRVTRPWFVDSIHKRLAASTPDDVIAEARELLGTA